MDPSPLVRDLKDIIEWFEKLSNEVKTDSDSLEFIEPNLKIELIKNKSDLKTVRIIFDLESRPQDANDNIEYYVDCKMDNSYLTKVVEELTKELASFPERAIG